MWKSLKFSSKKTSYLFRDNTNIIAKHTEIKCINVQKIWLKKFLHLFPKYCTTLCIQYNAKCNFISNRHKIYISCGIF